MKFSRILFTGMEWVMQKSYAIMEKQLFDEQLAYMGGKLS